MTKAAIYARRSTDEQGASLDDQEAEGRAYAAERGWSVVAVYRESASGFKPGTPRPALDRMLADAASGDWQHLVVWRLNRLSRQEGADSALAAVWNLRKLGVEVHSIKEPSSGHDMADDLQRLIASYQASAESRVKSEDTQRGKLRSIRQHGVFHGGFPPYGYRRAGTMPAPGNAKKNIVRYDAEPTAAAVVAELLRRYLAGESPHALAVDLNERGVEPPKSTGVSANRHARRGGPVWQEATIRNLLRNPLLGGWASYRGARVKACSCSGDCSHDWTRSLNLPALVDEQTWEAVQARVASRRGRVLGGRATGGSSETFLLLGLLFCGECGERLACRKARQSNTVDRYVCAGRRRKGCTMPTIRRTLLDEAIRQHFVSEYVVDTEESVRRERERLMGLRSSEADLIRDELEQVRQELGEVRRLQRQAQLDYEAGELTAKPYSRLDAEYDQRITAAEAAQRRLEARRVAIEGAIPVAELDELLDRLGAARRMIAGALEGEDVPRMNAKLHEVFDSITVSRQGDGLLVVPHLRDESPLTRVLDFSEGAEATPDLEVVPELVVLRKVELTRPEGVDDASNPW
jgi:site-specific DNA recombinase